MTTIPATHTCQGEPIQVLLHQFAAPSSRNLLPLAAGLLTAYARSIPALAQGCEFELVIARGNPAEIVAGYRTPRVLGFSAYFWNLNQSLQVARLAKKAHPEALVVFGGPIVPIHEEETRAFFREHPYVDVVVAGEGELVFAEILLGVLEGRGHRQVEGISYLDRESGAVHYRPKRPYLADLSRLASPYLDGTFDALLARHPEAFTGAIIETNRGCPFSCSYCYWGGPDSKIVEFPLERVLAELDWIAAHRFAYVSGADANLGILPRDLTIARYVAQLNLKTGYPKFLAINWTKNSDRRVLDIAEALAASGVRFMITSSVQSYNPETLAAVRRKNIKYRDLVALAELSARNNYEIHYSELILGLPLETYESFRKGLEHCLIENRHYYFNIYYLFLIPSTEMHGAAYREKYGIEVRTCQVSFERTREAASDIPEYEDIVVGTSTLPVPQWQRTFTLAYLVKGLYGYRLAYFLGNFLRNEYRVDLMGLFEWLAEHGRDQAAYPVLGRILGALEELELSILSGGRTTIKLPGCATSLHPEMAVLVLALERKEAFFAELGALVTAFLAENRVAVDAELFGAVLAFQQAVIPTWQDPARRELAFDYNLDAYFDGQAPLARRPTQLAFVGQGPSDSVDGFLARHIYGGLRFEIAGVERVAPSGWQEAREPARAAV